MARQFGRPTGPSNRSSEIPCRVRETLARFGGDSKASPAHNGEALTTILWRVMPWEVLWPSAMTP